MATKKYLDSTGLTHLWTKIKLWVANYAKITTSEGVATITIGGNSLTPALKSDITDVVREGDNISNLTNDANYITLSQVPEGAAASSATPLMDGTAAVGTETAFARGDHRHPSDTSKLSLSGGTMTGTLTLHAEPTADLLAATKKYVDDNKITNNNQIANGAGYQTAAQVTLAINSALSSTMTYKGTVAAVSNLPTTGNKNGDTYHVTADGSEYAWNGTSWEELGRDLSGFLLNTDVDALTNSEIDTATADTTIPATT